MITEPAIHYHFDLATPATPDETRERIIAIATSILEAFDLEYETAHQDQEVVFNLGQCRTVSPAESARYDTERDAEPEILRVPIDKPVSESLWGGSGGPHQTIRWVAAAEIGLALREAGVIRNYCDQYYWSRRCWEHTPDAVRRGLATLNARTPGQEPNTRCPDPAADEIARHLFSILPQDNFAVILFGSRQRGDHIQTSDVDLIIHWTGDWETRIPQANQAIDRFLDEAANSRKPDIDVSIAAQWDEPIWDHPSQILNPDGGAATIYASSLRAIVGIPLALVGDAPPTPTGSPARFLTDGVMVTDALHRYAKIQYLCRGNCKR